MSYKYSSLIFAILCTSLLSGTVYAEQRLSISQKIGEQTCLLTTVVKTDGSFGYVLLPGCGTLVSPAGSTSAEQRTDGFYRALSSLMVPATNPVAKSLHNTDATYLEAAQNQQPVGGYVLLTGQGGRYTFRLADDSLGGAPRMFEVLAVNDSSLTLRFWPLGRTVVVPLGPPSVRIDLNGDGEPDIRFDIVQLNADGSALLRVRFVALQNFQDIAAHRRDTLIVTGVLLSAAAALLVLSGQQWLLRKRGRVPPYWWVEHVHDPTASEHFLDYQWNRSKIF